MEISHLLSYTIKFCCNPSQYGIRPLPHSNTDSPYLVVLSMDSKVKPGQEGRGWRRIKVEDKAMERVLYECPEQVAKWQDDHEL